MAQIIRNQSALKEEYFRLKKQNFRTAVLAAVFVLIAIVGSIIMNSGKIYAFGMTLTALSVIGFFVCIVHILSLQSDLAIKKQGVEGEDITADILRRSLSDKYTVFQNSVITLDGKSSEIDFIVVGENGVFVVETKRKNGRITGDYNKERWTQHKTGRRGTEYSSEFYSPVKQVKTHIFRLAGYLKRNGIGVHIDGAVYFSNEEACLELSGSADKIPVFCRKKALISFINNNENKIRPDTVEKINKLLK